MGGLINSGMHLAAWTLDLVTSHTVELGHPQEWLRHYLVENLQKDGARGVKLLSQRCAQLSPQSWKVLSDFIRCKNQEELPGSHIHWVLLYVDHNRPSSHRGVFARSKTPPSLEVILGRQDYRGPSWSFEDPPISRLSSVANGTEVQQADATERSASPLTTPTTKHTAEAGSVPDINVSAYSQSAEAQPAIPSENHGHPNVPPNSNDRFLRPSAPTKSSMKSPSSQSASRTDPPKVSFEDPDSEGRRPGSLSRESMYSRGDRSYYGPTAPEYMDPLTYSVKLPHPYHGYGFSGSHRGMPPPPLPPEFGHPYGYPPSQQHSVASSDRRQGSTAGPSWDDYAYYPPPPPPPPSHFPPPDPPFLFPRDSSLGRAYGQQPSSTYNSQAPSEYRSLFNRRTGSDYDSDEDAQSKSRRMRRERRDVTDDFTVGRREIQKRSMLKAELRHQKERQQKEESSRKRPESFHERGDQSFPSYAWHRRHSPSPSPPPLSRHVANLHEKRDILKAEERRLEEALHIARERREYARADDLQFGAIPQIAEDIEMVSKRIGEAEVNLERRHKERTRSSRSNPDYGYENRHMPRSVDSYSNNYPEDEWALVPARAIEPKERVIRRREAMSSDESDERSEIDGKLRGTPDQTVASTLNDNEIILKALEKYTTFQDKKSTGPERKTTIKEAGRSGKTKIPKRLVDKSILLQYGKVEEESNFAEGPEEEAVSLDDSIRANQY